MGSCSELIKKHLIKSFSYCTQSAAIAACKSGKCEHHSGHHEKRENKTQKHNVTYPHVKKPEGPHNKHVNKTETHHVKPANKPKGQQEKHSNKNETHHTEHPKVHKPEVHQEKHANKTETHHNKHE